MFSFRRRLPPSSKLLFLVALACAGSAAWIAVGQLPGGRADQGAPPITVVAAARDIAAGTTVGAGDLTTMTVAADLVPAGVIHDADEAVGRVALTPFVTGEPVAASRLAAAAGPAAKRVPPGLVGVTLVPDAAPAALGAGDRVDVLATYTSARPYTTAVAEDALVLAVIQGSGTFGEGGAATVTLMLDPYVAREVVRADVTAHVSLAVRGYVTPSAAPASTSSPATSTTPTP
jgi:Flp pilus assembly protein CpaB